MKKPSTTILLGLGANLGDREQALRKAITLLEERRAIYAPVLSSVYETEPVGYTDQPPFLNMVMAAGTMLLPEKLLAVCREVERAIGRVDRAKWHEREIDIDILLYQNKILATEQFSVPHPHMHERRFVLEPAAEVAPNIVHPVLRRTMSLLLEQCRDTSAVRKIGELAPGPVQEEE